MAKRKIRIEELIQRTKPTENKVDSIKSIFKDTIDLATEIAKDYPDSADWKDAYGHLHTKAKKLLDKISQFVK